MNTGVYQYGGMACCVMINDGKSKEKMSFVTSSDVVACLKADKKPTEMHPYLKKKRKDCHLVADSTVNNFGPFSFLSMHPQSSPGACFSKVPKLFGPILGATTGFIS